LGQSKSR